ncbi:GNAT family N-acetyltransferase [Nibribacter ruber]|uniref:GNAT family N-acetyltransferase n=1 Tax=Nibribacter ruber TaxID=2698458 RepID=A0A6P1NZG3_9BACT|nr:GNAT family N-acetyltransferase [Nibribacter ruber]QHL87291.1 GNAT family N-acetyltransferase [Nibribacter ruber]
MLRYLQHHEIDFAAWDQCLEASSNAIIYGFTWYLDTVAPGWHAIVKEEAGQYVAILPIPVFQKFGFKVVRQPIFAQQLGVFHREPLTPEEWQQVGQILQKQFTVISSYEFNTGNTQLLETGLASFKTAHFSTYHLPLQKGYPAIVAGYRKDRRWRINQAKRAGLIVRPSVNIDLIIQIFAEHIAHKIYGVIGEEYEYKMLRQLYAEASTRGLVTMHEAVNARQEVVAMIMLFHYNQKLIYIFNSSTSEGKKTNAISFLVDHILHAYAGQDLVYDFEAPEVGPISDFYSSFGSTPTYFLSVSANNLPAPLQWLQKLRAKAFSLIKN